MKKRLLNILFWSVISAAFIGPGTITTASLAGASFGASLLWALLFSTIACVVLQEGAARITIASNLTIGEAVSDTFGSKPWIKWVLGCSVIFGCAAYEAGNIIGAVSGAGLLFRLPKWLFTIALSGITFSILWSGSANKISKLLGVLVAVMGVAFLYTAFFTDQTLSSIAAGLILPQIPADGLLLVVGLIGTTIVPYNLFLGSGLGKGQNLAEMRFGLLIAVGLGGLVSMGVLLTGTKAPLPFNFESMAVVLEESVGPAGSYLFAVGLFAAGFTSSVTAPLASAITAQSLWGKNNARWAFGGANYRLVWGSVLLVGFIFGMLELRPIPVILLAQAVNGILLPVAAVGLLIVLNDRKLMNDHANGLYSNMVGLLIVVVTLFLGAHSLARAIFAAFNFKSQPDTLYFVVILAMSLIPSVFIALRIFKKN